MDDGRIVVSQTSHLFYKSRYSSSQAELAATNHVMTTRGGASADVRQQHLHTANPLYVTNIRLYYSLTLNCRSPSTR